MRQQGIKVIAPLSRGLPKTGQIVSYLDGDDGDIEAGWWLGLLNENNRTRFVEKEYVSGKPVIIDLATKLMWPKDIASSICRDGTAGHWSVAFAWLNGRTWGSFSDWRLPNVFEMLSLANLNEIEPSTYKTIFTNWNVLTVLWTASTDPSATTNAIRVSFTDGCYCGKYAKTNNLRFIPCRRV